MRVYWATYAVEDPTPPLVPQPSVPVRAVAPSGWRALPPPQPGSEHA